MPNTLTRGANARLVSLDAFRGLTVAGMVLVNNPGSWSHIYWPLEHAEWHGWTPTDLVFPFFLFIVGVSIALSLGRRLESLGSPGGESRLGGTVGSQRDLLWKIIKRSAIIFVLGLFLNGFPYFNFSEIRIAGVLQRIALCYFFAAIISIKTNVRTQVIIAVALLLIYWILMTRVPVPGTFAGDLSKEGSLASLVDRAVLGKHIWKQGKVYDPEGLLSTIPAIATTLFGVLTGHWLRSNKTQYEKVAGMFIAGMCCIVIGWMWNPFFPINKSLWTSSYVFFTAGMALQTLASCYWLIDIKKYRRWARPFVVFGVNAIALFVGTALMAKLIGLVQITLSNGSRISLQAWIYRNLFLTWAAPINASLAFAIAFILLWLGLMWILYSQRIFIKV
jgi:predicted acyltransferase